jgi:unsaturated chondroitin disaccharide hydrolase
MSGDLFSEAWRLAEIQGGRLIAGLERGFPHVTDGGRWRRLPADRSGGWHGDAWEHGAWTGGFTPGFLWHLYAHTRAPRWAEAARGCLPAIAPRANDPNTHDVGYLFWPSFALGADLTGDPGMREVGLTAARNLAGRLQPGGYIAAWGPLHDERARGSSTIDTMMNLPLLWWGREGDLRAAAHAHARTAARVFLRPDGSTYHRVRFDPQTGEVLERGTFQGLGPESCWSRGQAWAIAGFALAWRETADPELHVAAQRVADHFLTRLGHRPVPPWDFGDPDPAAPLDSSAAVIAACGLLDLGREAEARAVLTGALDACLNRGATEGDGGPDGLLLHACYSRPHDDAVDAAVIWGDYFCLTCLARVRP